jgi:two-component system LytT family response regulator
MREAGRPASHSLPVRALVVDDEPAAREAIITLLADRHDIVVIGEATNGRDAVECVRRLEPDLLFLDIQMPDQDGFRVLEVLGQDVPRGVVFVTAHDEHAIRAFEVHALDYLLKPFGRQRFLAAVERALERLSALDALTLQRTLASIARDRRSGTEPAGELAVGDTAPARTAFPRRLAVRNGARIVLVDVNTIDWIEAEGDYARIHASAKTHLVAQRMHALERMLDGEGDFIRVHRSLIVNLRGVRELHREADGGGTLVLRDGIRLRVARGRWDALQSALRLKDD